MKTYASIPAVIFFLSAAACSNETVYEKTAPSEAARPGMSVATYCGPMCARTEECNRQFDEVTCVRSCENASAAVVPRIRPDVLRAVVACLDAQDCKSVLDGNQSACLAEAIAATAPSAAAANYCDTLVAAKESCGATTDKASCLRFATPFVDSTLDEAQTCTSRSCAQIDACAAAAFGAWGGGGLLPGATKPDGNPPPTHSGSEPSDPSRGGSGASNQTPTCAASGVPLGACGACAASEACCSIASECWRDADCTLIMQACSLQPDTCAEVLGQITEQASRQKAGRLFQCAQTSCDPACNWTTQFQ